MYSTLTVLTDRPEESASVHTFVTNTEDADGDSPLVDSVSMMLKRENSIRRSKSYGRLEHSEVKSNS